MTGRLEPLDPIHPGRVGMYTCGPTVWNFVHVGNLRTFLFYDLLRRHLEASGLQVTHVMNLTDIDDRILGEANRAGVDFRTYTEPFARAFLADLARLRVRPATFYPRATDHIADMIDLISILLDRGAAYRAEDGVYFRIDAFPAYGRLSRLAREGLRSGARVSTDRYDKETVYDFALWKFAQPRDEAVGAVWPAPFGAGRPGWHIECSAMARRLLGDSFDIHCGGVDLVFPHHENEIAQSEAATGVQMCRMWLHPEHLLDATGGQMSKSLGNFATLGDLIGTGHTPTAIRLFLLGNAHWRTRLSLDAAGLAAGQNQVRRLRELRSRLSSGTGSGQDLRERIEETGRRFQEALDDDLNLPMGLGYLFDLVRQLNTALDGPGLDLPSRQAALDLLHLVDGYIDVLEPEAPAAPAVEEELPEPLRELVEARQRARAVRDFATADRIREELARQGIRLIDTRDGVTWIRERP